MDRAALRVETDPDLRDVRALEDAIYRHNVAATGIADGELLAVFVRDEAGALLAGLYKWTWGGCCEIRDLWVRAAERGRGWGTQLLMALSRCSGGYGRPITAAPAAFRCGYSVTLAEER